MKLENVFVQKRNSNVTVNGHTYTIGAGGFIQDKEGKPFDVPEEDARKLLQGRAWKELGWDPEDPANAGKFAPHVGPGGIPLRKGRLPRDMSQVHGAPQAKGAEKPEAKPIMSDQLPPQEVYGPGSGQLEKAGEVKERTVEEGEWPDPTEEMSLEYLRQMADAYEVSYTARTGVKRLVSDITKAMYPEE